MKFNGDKKYLWWGLTIFLVVSGIILFYYFIFHITNVITLVKSFFQIIMPIVDGFVLAYLLTPAVNFLENKVIYEIFGKKIFSPKAKRKVRFLTVLVTMIIFVFFVYEFFKLVIPEIAVSVAKIDEAFPDYVSNLERWVNKLLSNNPDIEKTATNLLNDYSEEIDSWLETNDMLQIKDLLKALTTGVFSVIKSVWNFVIGFIISVYLLCGKENFMGQAKKLIYALFKRDTANAFIHNIRFTHKTFIGFFLGKIVDSIIIGFLCFMLTKLIGTPYPVLISVVIGVTNIIPFFGPYIGAIPCAFLVLMVDPIQFIYFVIMIVLLQQFDGNILGPKILGDSTGLSGFWVIFSITLFGGLFGIVGMLVGVPVFAVIFASIKAMVKSRLEVKGIDGNTDKFINVDYINEDNEFIKIEKKDVDGIVSKKKFKLPFKFKK